MNTENLNAAFLRLYCKQHITERSARDRRQVGLLICTAQLLSYQHWQYGNHITAFYSFTEYQQMSQYSSISLLSSQTSVSRQPVLLHSTKSLSK